jgi:hypothetical protein
MEKDTTIAAFGAAIGLAGIVLVFMGFVSAQGEGFQNNKRKDAFKRVAKFGSGTVCKNSRRIRVMQAN